MGRCGVMGSLLHGNRVTLMEKKRTNSGPCIQATRKYSIYTPSAPVRGAGINMHQASRKDVKPVAELNVIWGEGQQCHTVWANTPG